MTTESRLDALERAILILCDHALPHLEPEARDMLTGYRKRIKYNISAIAKERACLLRVTRDDTK
jgi:hypothetical protein